MDSQAKLAADTLRKMANFKQMLAFPYETGKIINECADIIESLSAQLDQVARERDVAVEDISRECHKCKHFKVLFNGCTPDYDCDRSDVCRDNDNWQWRGVENHDAST